MTSAHGHWMRPSFNRHGVITLGPLQFNWYGKGCRFYLTWPGRTRTLRLG